MRRVELLLANGRAFLAVCSLAAIYLDPTEPSVYAGLAYLLMIIYVVESLVLLYTVRSHELMARSVVVIHLFDILFGAVIMLFTRGPSSPFFLFFIFVLVAAAFRWGLRETMMSSFACIALLAFEAMVVRPQLIEGDFELNRLVIRFGYLLVLGLFLGSLADSEHTYRAEILSTSRILTKLQRHTGLRESLEIVLKELIQIFEARAVLFPVRDKAAGKTFLWSARVAKGSKVIVENRELDAVDEGVYLFAAPASFCAKRGEQAPPEFWQTHDAQSLLAATSDYHEDWTGRVYVLDARLFSASTEFFETLMRQIGPALYSANLLRRLRSRAGALARARVSNQLHDGVIQSTIALEMEVHSLRRRLEQGRSVTGDDLFAIQKRLREEVLNLRELMQELKPVDINPGELLDYLAEMVDKFRRDTGIDSRFACDLDDVILTSRGCRQVVRLVQEALANVRKHSGAKQVIVRLDRHDKLWNLSIQDDGHGFGFSGRITPTDTDSRSKAPAVIHECVRSMGGDLTIDSSPSGARLEITFPDTDNDYTGTHQDTDRG